MLRGDPTGAMPIASGSARRLTAQRTGPLPDTVRARHADAVGAPRHTIVPTRP